MPVISRPLLVVLALAVVALVGFYATQGSREAASDGGGAPPAAERVADPPAQATKPDSARADKAADPSRPARADEPAKSETDRGGEATTAADRALADAGAPSASGRRPAATGGPATVRRALARGDVAILFFGSPAGADDTATGRAVAAQDGVAGVTVVREPVGRLADYQELVGTLGISQAPVVVVVGAKRGARLLEGYVDGATLRQEIADAR